MLDESFNIIIRGFYSFVLGNLVRIKRWASSTKRWKNKKKFIYNSVFKHLHMHYALLFIISFIFVAFALVDRL